MKFREELGLLAATDASCSKLVGSTQMRHNRLKGWCNKAHCSILLGVLSQGS